MSGQWKLVPAYMVLVFKTITIPNTSEKKEFENCISLRVSKFKCIPSNGNFNEFDRNTQNIISLFFHIRNGKAKEKNNNFPYSNSEIPRNRREYLSFWSCSVNKFMWEQLTNLVVATTYDGIYGIGIVFEISQGWDA